MLQDPTPDPYPHPQTPYWSLQYAINKVPDESCLLLCVFARLDHHYVNASKFVQWLVVRVQALHVRPTHAPRGLLHIAAQSRPCHVNKSQLKLVNIAFASATF